MPITPSSVDEYINSAPEDVQPKLRDMRSIILEVCPDAEEKISYGMPYYGYYGRLAYFASAKTYTGLYIPPPIIAHHAEHLKSYVTTKSAIHFPYDQELPTALIKKLIKARMQWSEDHKK